MSVQDRNHRRGGSNYPTCTNGEMVAAKSGFSSGIEYLADKIRMRMMLAATIDKSAMDELLAEIENNHAPGRAVPDYVIPRAASAVEGENGRWPRTQ